MADKMHSFEAYFKRAVSPVLVLAILKEKPMYGYEIASAVRKKSNDRYSISIMYPILDNLAESGFIAEDRTVIVDGRARKYYAITKEGKAYLTETVRRFRELSSVFYQLTEEEQEYEKEEGPESCH